MMNIQSAGALIFAMIATSAMGAVTTTVVDVPTRGVTQRFLYVHPDAPAANIVSLAGGGGVMGIQNDGTMTTVPGLCNPVGRTRQAFADHGLAVALVDATSDGLTYNFDDVLEVIRYMQARDNVPTWVIGGSSATPAIWTLANKLPTDMPVGAIFWSPDPPNVSQVALIKRPTQVVYHAFDTGQFGPALFAALTSAPVREQVSFTGGTDAGCGYHLFIGLDAEFAAATTGFIDKYNGTLGVPVAVNYQGLWYAAPAGSEAGWGINFTHQGDTVFASWFTFDLTGKGLWLVMTATKTGNGIYTGTLFQLTGPPFDAVPFPPLGSPGGAAGIVVGTGTLTFTGASDGSFAYTVNGISQTKTITRQAFGTMPTCAHSAQPNLALATNYQDLWWAVPGGSESGWGINLTHQGDTIFASWFTFDRDRTPMWLVVTAPKTAPGTFTGTLYRLTGPAFNAVPFPPLGSPGGAIPTSVGTATFTFTDGNTATFAYTVNGSTQSKNITRELFQPPAGTVCQ
jgi:hypothetical protein